MCFSVQADLAVGAAIVPVAAMSLAEVRRAREVPFAALPAVFAVHQLIESLVWAGTDGDVSARTAHVAALAYVAIALPLLPVLVPVAVLLLEPWTRRLRTVPFVAIGAAVAAYFSWTLVRNGVSVTEHPHALAYDVHLQSPLLWTGLYIVAVIGASLLSGYRSIVVFGVLNLVGLCVVAYLYTQAFASVWCIYAAVTSLLVLVHMWRRRHLPEAERIGGHRS